MSNFEVFHLYAESSIHAGSGVDLGMIDLPIQREKHTDYPVIWSSSLKGAVRSFSHFEKGFKDKEEDLFGSWEEKGLKSGKLAFGDAKILAFPVRSVNVPFVWITSLDVLNKYMKTVQLTEKKPVITMKEFNAEALVSSEEVLDGNTVYLEEFGLKAEKSDEAETVANFIAENAIPDDQGHSYLVDFMKKRLVIVKDDVFAFLVKTLTEVNPRIRINRETGTVEKGGLWYEEDLPEDTVMYFLLSHGGEDDSKKFVEDFDGKVFTLGGNKTIGKGLFKVRRLK